MSEGANTPATDSQPTAPDEREHRRRVRRRRHRGPGQRSPRQREVVEEPVEVAVEPEPAALRDMVRAAMLAVLPMVVCLFGAGRETWSQGLAVGLMGAAMLLAPPRARLPAGLTIALVLLAVAPFSGLLPAAWFGGIPEWRRHLVTEWALPLGQAVSSQPAATLEASLVMFCMVVWLWHSLGQRFAEQPRRILLRTLVCGGGVLAVLTLLEHWHWVQIPWWPRDERSWGLGFGPFSNRNHTSALCALTGVMAVAVAYDALRRKSWWWIAGVISFLACMVAIFANSSRGGLLLLVLGIPLWLVTSAIRKRWFQRAVIAISLMLLIGSLVLISKGNMAQRLKSGVSLEQVHSDFRVLLAQESLAMADAAPFAGIGLGNFASAFPQVTTLGVPTLRFLHPESSLLWLLTEGGLFVLLPALLVAGLVMAMAGPWFGRPERGGRGNLRLRRAAGVVAGMVLIHSLFDVSLHGIGLAMLTLLVMGAAVRPEALKFDAGPVPIWAARALGLGLMVLGAGWFAIAQGRLDLPLASAAKVKQAEALRKSKTGRAGEALRLIDRAVAVLPMDYGLHYMRGQLRLHLGDSPSKALLDFGRARAVEPNVANFCYWEGAYWLAHDPILAAVPWREWIRRNRVGAEAMWGGFRQMVLDAEPYPNLLTALRQMASTPSMKLIFLMAAPTGADWNQCLADLMAPGSGVETLGAEQVLHLLGTWSARGDRQAMIAELEVRPEWHEVGWRFLAEEYAKRGDFKRAYEVAEKNHPPRPKAPALGSQDIASLQRKFVLNPSDPGPGVELYYAQRAAGANEEALYTLQEVQKKPHAPSFLKREEAAIWAERGDYRRAWEQIRGSGDGPG